MKSFKNITEAILDPNSTTILNKVVSKWNSIKDKIYKETEVYDILDILNDSFYTLNILFILENHETSPAPIYKKAGIVGAIFDDENDEIVVSLFKRRIEKFINDPKSWNYFFIALKQIISHEIIHQMQMKNIPRKKIPKILSQEEEKLKRIFGNDSFLQYYGSKHEVQAFAFELINELIINGYDKNQIIKMLEYPSTVSMKKSFTLFRYYETFYEKSKTNKESKKILNKLLSYAYSYLKTMK